MLEENGQRLLKLNPTGTLLWAVGEPGVPGSDNAHFNWPHGVAVGKDRRIYVADNCRVQIFSGDGSYMATLGTGCGTGDYEFDWATGIAVGDNGYIYVSDANNHRVQIFDQNRVFVGRIGVTGQCGTDNAHLCAPIGIDVDSSNNIYVADINNCRVQKFSFGMNAILYTDFIENFSVYSDVELADWIRASYLLPQPYFIMSLNAVIAEIDEKYLDDDNRFLARNKPSFSLGMSQVHETNSSPFAGISSVIVN